MAKKNEIIETTIETLIPTKNISIIVRKDYYSHYDYLEKPDIFKINYVQRTNLGIELSKNTDIDVYLYKLRHLVENMFARIKHFRAIATRFDKLKRNFISNVALACLYLWLPM